MRSLRAHFVGFAIAALIVGATGGAGAQGITAEQAQQILSELTQIRQLLERTPHAPLARTPPSSPVVAERAKVGLGSGVTLGRAYAPLTLVEFTDYECPFCRQF